MLKSIETAKIRYPKRGDDYEKQIRAVIKEHLPLSVGDAEEMYDERRKDHLSHFILRLAYCKSEDLRRWFLTQECELFRYRFNTLNPTEITSFIRDNEMNYEPIDDAEKLALLPKLKACGFKLTEETVKRTDYFKVNFEEALDLVKHRRVFISRGFAYVPRSDLLSIIAGAFRLQLSMALTLTSKALPQLEEDSRLLPMLGNLSKQYLGTEYGTKTKTNAVTAADVPALAEESFPMCMRHSQSALTETHHLKHGARMQYGLFLKGIGMKLEDALLFWRTEFTKAMGADKFEKSYAYNIRHNYGKEGKRTDYTPYSCMKIIMSSAPAAGDAHGCPFRHSDIDTLRMRMHSYKISPAAINDISGLVQNQHYQLACVKYFEVTHNVDQADLVLQHPNQYYEKSRELRTGEKNEGEGKGSYRKPAATPTAAAETPTAQADELDDDALAGFDMDAMADVGDGDGDAMKTA